MFRNLLTGALLAAALVLAPAAGLAPVLAQVDLNSPIDTAAVSVTSSATSLLSGVTETSTPFKEVTFNPTDGEIAVGGASVTASTGILVGAGEKMTVPWSRGKNWYAIRTGGSNVNVRVLPVR